MIKSTGLTDNSHSTSTNPISLLECCHSRMMPCSGTQATCTYLGLVSPNDYRNMNMTNFYSDCYSYIFTAKD